MVSLVRTRNGNTTRETIDIVDMVRKGELNRDYEVAGGDIIFVERAPRAYITGEVQRPGPFRIERAMTVQQALSAGGGLTPRGTQRGVRITRKDAERHGADHGSEERRPGPDGRRHHSKRELVLRQVGDLDKPTARAHFRPAMLRYGVP
jgi:protein involved in polysaccharide export with SLBB domain